MYEINMYIRLKGDKGSIKIYGMGGGSQRKSLYNSRESPYLRLIFTQHTIWTLRNPKISTVRFRLPTLMTRPISFVPPNDASKIFRPPPFDSKIESAQNTQKT